MRRKEIIVLSLSMLVAVIVRGYMLGQAPHGLYVDEASIGWNAYSIFLTGKDEFGKALPVVFRSFADFKTPIYIYLLAPLLYFFELSKFATRLPSFFFGILTLPPLYFLIRNLSPSRLGVQLGLLTVFLLSFSPWHVLFGRAAFETNVALFFMIAGLYFFYKGLIQQKYLLVAAVLLGIAVPAYHAQRLVTPFLLLVLAYRYRHDLIKHRKALLGAVLLGLVVSIPTLSVAFTPGFSARASLNIFSNGYPYGFIDGASGFLGYFINAKLFLWFQEFSSLYMSYFSPRSMFGLGDFDLRSSYPEIGTFFVWQFPFYVYGIYILARDKRLGALRRFLIAFLLIAPIPAAVTRDPYSTIRALPLVVPQITIIGLGMIYFYRKLNFAIFKNAAFVGLGVLTIYSVAKLWSSAIILNEHYRGRSWDYGWEEVVSEMTSFQNGLPVVIDNARFEPYSQIVFFTKFDPGTYHAENFEVELLEYYTNLNRVRDKQIGNVTTRSINWERDIFIDQYLVGDELAISKSQIEEHKLTLVREVLFLDGKVAYRITKTNPDLKTMRE